MDATCPAADPRNQEDEEGFCTYEFFSLDYTLSLYIYSKLCYFRDHCAGLGTPGCLCALGSNVKDDEAHAYWLAIVDKMIEAFRLQIAGVREGHEGVDQQKIREGMQLFVDFFNCLWY